MVLSMLIEALLKELLIALEGSDMLGIFLTGSLARGEANVHSDIDLKILYEHEPLEIHRYEYRHKRLVSITSLTQEKINFEFSKSEHAIWAVPGFRQAKILHDPFGILEQFKTKALEFDFSKLQTQANFWASQQLQGWSEEAHRIMGGLELHDVERLVAPIWGIGEGMTRIVAVAHGVMIESENLYFKTVRVHLGLETTWAKLQMLALGFESLSLETRAHVALELYVQTVALLEPIIQAQHLAVISQTLERIVAFNTTHDFGE